jgi:UDP-glucuronate 4-epimerase
MPPSASKSPSSAPILVTGAAGFIGFHLCQALLKRGYAVEGLDNLTGAADPSLQRARWAELSCQSNFRAWQMDLLDADALHELFVRGKYRKIVHLAARVGVRDSVEDPHAYLQGNLTSFLNLLEECRKSEVEHLLYASSSSVYGASSSQSFAENQAIDEPQSFYAVTKRSNELMARAWFELYGLASTGLRFFTVYGPWGRPEMAVYRFVEALEHGQEISLFNYGNMIRDFTYVDDVVESVLRLLEKPSLQPILNVGGGQPIMLRKLVEQIELATGKMARLRLMPNQAGDVPLTAANPDLLIQETGFQPKISVAEGVQRFVAWYRAYHQQEPALASGQEPVDLPNDHLA